jgi:hypothetical protein
LIHLFNSSFNGRASDSFISSFNNVLRGCSGTGVGFC